MEASQVNSSSNSNVIKNFRNQSTNPIQETSKNAEIKDSFSTTENNIANKEPEKSTPYKTGFYVAALGTVLAATALIYSRKSLGQFKSECSGLKGEVARLTENLAHREKTLAEEYASYGIKNDLIKQVEELTANNQALKENAELISKEKDRLAETLCTIPDEVITSSSAKAKQELAEMRNRISKPLEYEPLNPPVQQLSNRLSCSDKVFDFKHVNPNSSIRMHLADFRPPSLKEVEAKGKLEFTIPIENRSNIKNQISPDANEIKCSREAFGKFVDTDVKMNYGSTVKWSEEKAARDLMQNFYDGHGNTLEGVKVSIEHNKATGKYKIKVSGEGEYNHRDIEAFGSGTKKEDPFNAGGFGEGAKVFTVKMLEEFGVNQVKFASSGWEVAYKNGGNGYLQRNVQSALKPIKGNYVEFETDNKTLADAVLRSTNYFYHPQNPDFKGLTFENKDFAFKFLGANPTTNKGNVYLTQRFEYGKTGKWDNEAENVTVIFKRKPTEKGIIEENRDRIKITPDEIESLSKHFAKTMSDEELASAISALEPLWSPDRLGNMVKKDLQGYKLPGIVMKDFNESKIKNSAGIKLLNGLIAEAGNRNIKLKFSSTQKYVSVPEYHNVSKELLNDLKEQGYVLCSENLNRVGVKDVTEVIKEMRNRGALQPTENEIKRINILNDAAKLITESMHTTTGTNKVITPKDVVQPTYIFTKAESDNTLAEAITNYNSRIFEKEFLGHWIDREYLNSASFGDVLATRLHEACHKHGGDGSSDFGYKLTDMIADYNEIITTDPNLRSKLSNLKKLWNEIPKENAAKN